MKTVGPGAMLSWLRAAGEASRLRLLALCAEGGLSVSDLAEALRQSEPRISRHLKILCEAGLLERQPQGQWVHYRLASDPLAAGFVRGLLAQLDRRDPQMEEDRRAARIASGHLAGGPVSESRLGRALAAFATGSVSPGRAGALLLVGVAHPELLAAAATIAARTIALAPSRRAAQAARAFVARHGLSVRVLHVPGLHSGAAAALTRAGTAFDAVVLDHPGVTGARLAALLAEARGSLRQGGRLLIFEPYEALEGAASRVVEHPLARVRRLLSEVGFECERLSPIEADGEHVLAAAAGTTAQRQDAVGAHA